MVDNPRDYFLQSVQDALIAAGNLNLLKVYDPTKTYDAPYVFADLGLEELRDKTDESGYQVSEQIQEVFLLLGFAIEAQDTSDTGLLSAEANKQIYHIQKTLRKLINTIERYEDDECWLFVDKIRIVRTLDGYDNKALYGQALLTVEFVYTITLK